MPPELMLLIIAAVLVGYFLFWWFSADQVAKRRLEKAKAVSIADAPEGAIVKVTGRLVFEGEAALEGPLTGRTCAGFTVVVKERRQSGKSSYWKTVLDIHDTVDFVVEDETGRALVKAGGAKLLLIRDEHIRSGFLTDAPIHAEALLLDNGMKSENFLGMNKAMTFAEGVLEPGEEVAILGVGTWEMDPDPTRSEGYRDRAKRLVIDMADDGTMIISDDPSTL